MKSYALACFLVLAACGKSEEKSDESSIFSDEPVVWNAEVLQPGAKLTPYTSLAMKSRMNSEAENYMANPRQDEEEEGDTIECMEAIINGRTAVATDTSLTYELNADTSACLKEFYTQAGMTVDFIHTSVKWKLAINCSNGGLAGFDGKTFSELTAELDDPCGDGVTQVMNYQEIFSEYKFSRSGIPKTMEAKTLDFSALGMADGSGCSKEKNGETWTSSDGCLDISRTVRETFLLDGEPTDDAGYEDYSRIEDQGLSWAQDDTRRWYSSGTKTVQSNEWKGTVTYSDGKVAPTYALSANGETISGTISAQASLVQPLQFTLRRAHSIHSLPRTIP